MPLNAVLVLKNETELQSVQNRAPTQVWFPAAHADRGGPGDSVKPAAYRAKAADGRLRYSPVADERFLRSQRICRGRDFLLFRASKARSRGPGFLLVQKEGGAPGGRPRIAIVTSRKTGGAVRRNTLRRMVRELFRRIQGQLPSDSDWMVVFLPSSQGMLTQDLQIQLARKMLKMSK